MIALLAVAGAAAVQLVSADIEIDVAAGTARADYVLITDSTAVHFVALGSAAELSSEAGYPRWTRERGLYRLTAVALPGDTTAVHLRYRFPVGSDRVPVFVPSVPSDPPLSRISIRILGAAPTTGLADAFPRVVREPDGSLLAQPANLPSFVIIPGARGGLYVNRGADLVVVLLLLAATAAWWFRRR